MRFFPGIVSASKYRKKAETSLKGSQSVISQNEEWGQHWEATDYFANIYF